MIFDDEIKARVDKVKETVNKGSEMLFQGQEKLKEYDNTSEKGVLKEYVKNDIEFFKNFKNYFNDVKMRLNYFLENDLYLVTKEELDDVLESVEDIRELLVKVVALKKVKQEFYKKLYNFCINTSYDNSVAMINLLDETMEKELTRIDDIKNKNKEELVEIEKEEIEIKENKKIQGIEKENTKITSGKYPFSR